MRQITFILLVLTLIAALPLSAQSPLQPDGEPESGIVTLAPGFAPDPLRVPAMIGGGDIDAVNRQLGPDCAGFITATPDVRIALGGALPLLRLIFIADAITIDTTLVVRAPDGVFWCNNNSSGLFNPMVSIAGAAPGDYAVWVGGFTPGGPVYGELFITTREDARPGTTGLVLPIATTVPTAIPEGLMTPTPLPGSFLDPTLPPAHADVTLAHSFLPDPLWAVVVGGGELAVPPLDSGNPASTACTGFVTSEPDLRLTWSGVSPGIRFHLLPDDDAVDAALVVRTPDGRWLCNADFAPGGYTDPSVIVSDPPEGIYTVWAANETAYSARFTGALFITEINSTPETVRRPGSTALDNVAGLDPFASSVPVQFDQNAPDPLALSAPLGFAIGAVDVAALNPPAEGQYTPACSGFTTTAPTVTLNLPFATPYLRVFFVGAQGSDPTLVLRMPDGRWFCSDDSYNSKSPTIDVLGPPVSGLAQVWVGSYSPQDEGLVGTIYFTRGSATPVNPASGTPYTGLSEISLAPPISAVAYPTAAAFSTGPLTPGAAPNYGSVALVSANPAYVVAAVGGGAQDASKAAAGCVGAVSAQPDFRLDWQGAPVPLRIFFAGQGDPALVVLGPDGVFRCNDDSHFSQMPTVDIAAAAPGAWFIWVGSYDPAAITPGTLTITEDLTQTPVNP